MIGFRALCALVALTFTPQLLWAQQAGNRMVLRTGAPNGTVRTIRFSPDSKRLYAAGIDKQVHVWNLYDADGKLSPLATQSLHWPLNRAERGCIYSMDISANHRLAFGGYSARGNSGDIVVFDTLNRRQIAVAPARRPDRSEESAVGHRQPIIAISMAPGESRFATMSVDGETRYWSGDELNLRSQVLRKAGQPTDNQCVAFLDDQRVAYSEPTRKDANGVMLWQIVIHDTQTNQRSIVPTKHAGGVPAIVRDPYSPNRWASSDAQGRVYLWNGFNDPKSRMIDLWDHAVRSAAVLDLRFGPTDRLLASTAGRFGGHDIRNAKIVLLDLADKKIAVADSTDVGQSEHAHACDISPDGNLAAVYSGDTNEVWLFQIGDRKQSTRVLSPKDRVRLAGQGHRFHAVAFDKQTRQKIAVARNSDGEFDLSFDFSLRPHPIRTTKDSKQSLEGDFSRPATESADDWKLEGGVGDIQITLINRSQNQRRRISVDAAYQGPIQCHCWLRDKNGSVYAIAIGTTRQNGIFVYHVNQFDSNGNCKLLRYYRDHRGAVTSLSVSHDGELLASSSLDQTIKIWSLQGLEKNDPDSANVPGWGADFFVDGNRLSVRQLNPNGIIAQRDFKAGDTIERIEFKGKSIQIATNPSGMLDVLKKRPLWMPLQFTIAARDGAGQDKDKIIKEIYAGWQPLVSLFIGQDQSWVAWTPQGYYDASVIGDEFLGWVQDRGRDRQAAFYRAAHMRPELEKTEVIRQLLSAGSLKDSFRLANVPLPADYLDPVAPLLERAPLVKIRDPDSNQTIQPGAPVRVKAEVLFASPDDFTRFQVKAFANQNSRHPSIKREFPERALIEYEFEIKAIDPQAIVQVKLFEKENGGNLHSHVRHEDQVIVNTAARIGKMNVHVVGIGGSRYPGTNNDLSGSEDIIQFIENLVHLEPRSKYSLQKQLPLLGKNVVPGRLANLANNLQKLNVVENSDLMIVVISGHGDRHDDGRFFFIPTTCDPNQLTPLQKKERCIQQEELNELAKLQCRRLFVIDTCYAGSLGRNLTRDDVFQDERKQQLRDWRNENIAI